MESEWKNHALLKRHKRDKVKTGTGTGTGTDNKYIVIQTRIKQSRNRISCSNFIIFIFSDVMYFFCEELPSCCLLILILKLYNLEINIYSTNDIISFSLCEQIILDKMNAENILINKEGLYRKKITFFDYEPLDAFLTIHTRS